ncbi:hypothetical protein CW745_15070 [Psychromonas sp. psych-6C06]|nr:hypothetical protein CW745_15070 [Psychromonas sp. psych-6C06]
MNEFEQSLYNVLATLPAGKLCSYGQLAKRAGYPNHARHVGKTLSKLPSDTKLAWHRVINSQGKLSLTGDRQLKQKQRLLAEGIEVTEEGTVINFRHYLY